MTNARKTAADKAAKQIEAAVAAGKENVETFVKAGNEMASRNYEKVATMTKEQVEATFKAGSEAFKSVQGYAELAAFGKDNVDAVIESGAVLAKGAQDLNKAWFGLAQASVDEGISAARKMLACQTFEEVIEVQTKLAANGYGRMIDEGHKLSEASLKLAENAVQPLSGRWGAAVEQFNKQPAA